MQRSCIVRTARLRKCCASGALNARAEKKKRTAQKTRRAFIDRLREKRAQAFPLTRTYYSNFDEDRAALEETVRLKAPIGGEIEKSSISPPISAFILPSPPRLPAGK